MRCPQLYAMAATLIGIVILISATAGPQALITILRNHPIAHAFVLLTQFWVIGILCYFKAMFAAWFVFAMLAAAAVVTYGLSAFVIVKADDIRPLVKESMVCVGKAKTPEQKRQCRTRALEHLRAALLA